MHNACEQACSLIDGRVEGDPQEPRRQVGSRRVVAAPPVIGAGAVAPRPGHPHTVPGRPSTNFTTLDNQVDPTFNQLLGINQARTYRRLLRLGAMGHPNKGYLLSTRMARRTTGTRTGPSRPRPRSPA